MKTAKSAMQQLIDFLEPELKMQDFLQLPAYEKAKELLETEKQQIIDAYNSGWQYGFLANDIENLMPTQNSEQYYTSTFETNKETLK